MGYVPGCPITKHRTSLYKDIPWDIPAGDIPYKSRDIPKQGYPYQYPQQGISLFLCMRYPLIGAIQGHPCFGRGYPLWSTFQMHIVTQIPSNSSNLRSPKEQPLKASEPSFTIGSCLGVQVTMPPRGWIKCLKYLNRLHGRAGAISVWLHPF